MLHKKDNTEEWIKLREWINENNIPKKLIGLGGNIRSFLKMHSMNSMSNIEFKKSYIKLSEMSFDDMVKKYHLSSDRADVIKNALEIYNEIIKHSGIDKIKSTKWGVSDSIAVKLFHEIYSRKIDIKK